MQLLREHYQWIFSGAGVAVFMVALPIMRRVLFAMPLVFATGPRLYGAYEFYNWGVGAPDTIMRSRLVVRPWWQGGGVTLESVMFRYKGRLRLKRDTLFVELDGLNIDGRFYASLARPRGAFDVLHGVFSGVTALRQPLAGIALLRRVDERNVGRVEPSSAETPTYAEKIARRVGIVGRGIFVVRRDDVATFDQM